MNVGTNLWNANQNRDWTDWQQLEFNNKTCLPPWRTEFSFFLLNQHRLDNPQQPKRWGLIEPQDKRFHTIHYRFSPFEDCLEDKLGHAPANKATFASQVHGSSYCNIERIFMRFNQIQSIGMQMMYGQWESWQTMQIFPKAKWNGMLWTLHRRISQ